MPTAVSELWLPHEQFPDAGDLLEWDEGSFGDGLLRLYWGPQFGPGSERILNQPEVISNAPGLTITPQGGLPGRTLNGVTYYTWEDDYRLQIKNQLTWFFVGQITSTVNSFTIGDVQAEGTGYNDGLYVDSSGFPRFFVKTGGVGTSANGSSSVASAGLMVHIGTYDGVTIRNYFKGKPEGTAAKTGNVDTTQFATVLNRWAGAAGHTTGHFVMGGVANRCWSADEVRERSLRFASVFGHRIWVPVSVAGGTTYDVALTESATGTDAIGAALTALAALAEAASAADAPASTATNARILTEAATGGDAVAAALSGVAALTAAASAADAVASALIALRAVVEAASASDTASTGAQYSGAVAESASAADTAAAAAIMVRALTESAAAADATTAAAILVRLLTEPATAIDSVAAAAPATYNVSLAELAEALDVIAAALAGAVDIDFDLIRRVVRGGLITRLVQEAIARSTKGQ